MSERVDGVRPGSRVLVTGADGAIGRRVVDDLIAAGHPVTALSREWHAPSRADRVVAADAADADAVAAALEGVESVVHLAAIPHPGLGTPREVFVGNTSATFTVLDAAGAAGIRRAVIASSINAFGIPMHPGAAMPAYFPLDERMPAAHGDAYSLSKWVDEATARWVAERDGMSVVALRLPFTKTAEEVRTMAAQLRSDESSRARLVREGWSYLDLRDASAAIDAALRTTFAGAHVVLVAAEDTLLDEPTEELLDRYAPGVERLGPFPGRAGLVDTGAARALLGWRPRFDRGADIADVVGVHR